MEFAKLNEAKDRLKAKRQEIGAVLAEAQTSNTLEYDHSAVKSQTFKDGAAMRDWLQARNIETEQIAGEVRDLETLQAAAQNALLGGKPGAVEPAPTPQDEKPMSLADAFIASNAYKGYGGGGLGPTAHLDIDIRNTLFERTAGWDPEVVRSDIVSLIPERRAPNVVEFFNVIPTQQAAVKYIRETTYDKSAVVEKAEGAAFGEAVLALTEQTQTVEKVPVWIPVTDEQLEDEPAARAYIESRLVNMLRQRIDLQAMRGTGVTPLLLGTEAVTGIQTQAKGADPIPDAILKLFTKIRDDNDNTGGDAEPSVLFIQATKWQSVQLLRTADGIYIWGNPSQAGPMTIWGVPVVLTNAVTSTKAVSGDFRNHAFIAPRRGVDVQITNSHDTYFTSGKQAIRADVRLAIVHIRPAAFGVVTGL